MGDETKDAMIRVRVKPSTHVRLQRLAELDKREFADFVRLLLAEGMERRGKA